MKTFELIKSDGYALECVFNFHDKTYVAMDDYSAFPSDLCDFESPEFSILCLEDQTWEEMFQGNPNKERSLVQKDGWRYDGYGEVVSVSPVIVDFGDFTFEVGDFTSDIRCIGEFVHIAIDRLDLSFRPKQN